MTPDTPTPGLDFCPSCGFRADHYQGGICEQCYIENQDALDRHNAEYERWEKLDAEEREKLIREELL